MNADVSQQPHLTPVIGTEDWRLVHRVRGCCGPVHWDIKAGRYLQWDGWSAPWILRGLYPPLEPCSCLAGLLHDVGYRTQVLARRVYDWLLREVSMLCGMSAFRARTAYTGIRTGGWAAWRQNSKDAVEMARYRRLGRIWVVQDGDGDEESKAA